MSQCNPRGSLNGEEGRLVRGKDSSEQTKPAIAGFAGGGRAREAKECRGAIEAEKGKEPNSSLRAPEWDIQPC